MLLERHERQHLADRQAFIAVTGSFKDAPTWDGVEAALVEALEAEPSALDAEQFDRLRALELL